MLSRIVLFGLGNPGARYRWTRHNLGFQVLDALAADHGLEWSLGGRHHECAEDLSCPTHLFLVKPTTYVNLAGRGLREFLGECDIEPAEILVIADDIALPFGRLRLRTRGSHGGHNGLRSIIETLQTSRFPRLRMGVGPVPADEDPADFVLSRFLTEQRPAVNSLVARAIACIEDVIKSGFDRAMSIHNASDDEMD
jgi:PTH1 family peptidyl-tRNA hydrolase